MYKTFLIVIFVCLVFLVQGLFILFRGGFRYKIIGLTYILICFFIIFKIKIVSGITKSSTPAIKQAPIENTVTGDKTLHNCVSDKILPFFEKNYHVGMVVAAVYDDKTDITGYGSTSINSGIIPDEKTVFEIGSITKLFTASILSSFVETGKLDLDTSALKLLKSPPSDISDRKEKSEITLRHLVTHTSGLSRMPFDIFSPSQMWAGVSGGNSYSGYTSEKIKKIFAGSGLKSIPGEELRYSNIGYGLLGTLLSDYSGKPYENLVKDRICMPLGMNATGIESDPQNLKLAHGYRAYFRLGKIYLAQESEPWNFAEGMAGAGGLRSTAQDMLLFLKANMGRKDIKGLDFLSSTHEILFEDKDLSVGMGWFQDKLPVSGNKILFHDGISGGYASFIGMTEDRRFGIVILTNTSKPVSEIGYAVLDEFCSSSCQKRK